jgi:hypothetical protein
MFALSELLFVNAPSTFWTAAVSTLLAVATLLALSARIALVSVRSTLNGLRWAQRNTRHFGGYCDRTCVLNMNHTQRLLLLLRHLIGSIEFIEFSSIQ